MTRDLDDAEWTALLRHLALRCWRDALGIERMLTSIEMLAIAQTQGMKVFTGRP